MIVPSIDIVGGETVQLVGGEEEALRAGDPLRALEQFALVGEVAVVDIDAARGEGDNLDRILEMAKTASIRVGGGVRSYERAVDLLDAGARKVIVGTAASEGWLADLPRDRLIVALDARDGEVVTHGWRQGTGSDLLDSIDRFKDVCGGFLVTFVELEGRLKGTDLDLAAEVVAAADGREVTIAGGITTPEEVAALDGMGADAQVGMALYTGEMSLAEAFTAPLTSDRSDGLWPTVVVDEHDRALGLVYSDLESVEVALTERRGVYHSRSRGLWRKGETSGAVQDLMGIDVDCDRDALRFKVRQRGAFCHEGTRTCWGEDAGLARLERRLRSLANERPEGSNTVRLFDDPELLAAKLVEEASELADPDADVVAEAADLFYFALVKSVAADASLEDVGEVLDSRELRLTRRPMIAKKEKP